MPVAAYKQSYYISRFALFTKFNGISDSTISTISTVDNFRSKNFLCHTSVSNHSFFLLSMDRRDIFFLSFFFLSIQMNEIGSNWKGTFIFFFFLLLYVASNIEEYFLEHQNLQESSHNGSYTQQETRRDETRQQPQCDDVRQALAEWLWPFPFSNEEDREKEMERHQRIARL